MAYFYVPTTVRNNIEKQGEKMGRQVWRSSSVLYNRFVAFASRTPKEAGVRYVDPIGMNNVSSLIPMKEAQGTDAPINVYEDFAQGGTDMQLLIKRKKFQKPIAGDKTLQGTGSVTNWIYKTLRVAEMSSAINVKAGHFSELAYWKYMTDLVKQAQPELTDLFAMYINTAMIKRSIFYGKDYFLTLSATQGGRGLSKVSHPNMYVPGLPGGPFVDYTVSTDTYTNLPGTVGYETAVETAINSLTDTASKHFTTATLDTLRWLLPLKKIYPTVTIGGNSYYLCIATSQQLKQLTADTVWKQQAREILPRETDKYTNWLLTGSPGIYNGFVLLEDADGWGAHTNTNPEGYTTAPTALKAEFGPEDTVNSAEDWNLIKGRDTSNYQCFVILGSQSIDFGIAKKLAFTNEIWDHERKKEVGAYMISGCERTDQIDSDNQLGGGASSFVENTGSVIGITYSPAVA